MVEHTHIQACIMIIKLFILNMAFLVCVYLTVRAVVFYYHYYQTFKFNFK